MSSLENPPEAAKKHKLQQEEADAAAAKLGAQHQQHQHQHHQQPDPASIPPKAKIAKIQGAEAAEIGSKTTVQVDEKVRRASERARSKEIPT